MKLLTPMLGKLRAMLRLDRIGKGLFWGWNLAFLCLMFLGFAPGLLPEAIEGVMDGDLPLPFLGVLLVATLLPLAVSLLGYARLRDSGRQLLALGFGVEGPLMALLLLRVFGVREANPAMALLLGLTFVGTMAFLWQLIDRGIEERAAWWQGLRWVVACLLALVGAYVAAWGCFYLLPGLSVIVEVLQEWLEQLPTLPRAIAREFAGQPLHRWPLMLMALPVSVFTFLMALALPLGSLAVWLGAWNRARGAARARLGGALMAGLALAAVLALSAVFTLAGRQPQHRAFALLSKPPASPAEIQARKADDEALRLGLLNAYLASQRYVGVQGGVAHVARMYRSLPWPRLDREAAESVQEAYEFWVSPLLYQPVSPPKAGNGDRSIGADPARAAELYLAHFDVPILEAERSTIARTLAANWDLDRGANDRMEVDDREVLVTERGLELLTAAGGWAELELHEVYQNQTAQEQEVLYAFSLPESAVITGLWLGESEDPAVRQPFKVAPRGAAQQVYVEQRERRIDPALVEQVGPRQYRLRAFPVPPRRWSGETGRRAQSPGAPLHLWLRFVVPAQPAAVVTGAGEKGDERWVWPLPQLSDRSNAYWNRTTRWKLPAEVPAPVGQNWLPQALPADPAAAEPRAATLALAGWELDLEPVGPWTEAGTVSATGAGEVTGALEDEARLPRKLALLVDRSRSMEARSGEVASALEGLKDLEASGRIGAIDLYLGAPAASGQRAEALRLAALRREQLWAYGGQDPSELLAEFQQLAGGAAHDAYLILSDASTFNQTQTQTQAPAPWSAGPLWWIHLGGEVPSYPDVIQDILLNSGGGTAASVGEALRRWGLRAGAPAGAILEQVDGWRVTMRPAAGSARSAGPSAKSPGALNAGASSSPLRRVAARQVLQAQARLLAASAGELASLDQLHRLAEVEAIVSPFSSMIVTVNDAQRKRLAELSKAEDRFAREQEATPDPVPDFLSVTAVPEPGEWLLLAVALLLLWLQGGRRRGWRMG